jgi:hypothetical protein
MRLSQSDDSFPFVRPQLRTDAAVPAMRPRKRVPDSPSLYRRITSLFPLGERLQGTQKPGPTPHGSTHARSAADIRYNKYFGCKLVAKSAFWAGFSGYSGA